MKRLKRMRKEDLLKKEASQSASAVGGFFLGIAAFNALMAWMAQYTTNFWFAHTESSKHLSYFIAYMASLVGLLLAGPFTVALIVLAWFGTVIFQSL